MTSLADRPRGRRRRSMLSTLMVFLGLVAVHQIAWGGTTPTDLDNLVVYFTATDLGPMPVATCNTQQCFDERFTEIADISELYCDTVAGAIPGAVGYAPEGCVRWWEDQGPHNCGACGSGAQDDEWVRGHKHGQDDRQKPAFVSDCVNGQPCVRIPRVAEMGPNATQMACLELEFDDVVQASGDFSLLLLVAPRNQADDWWYFGDSNNGLRHSASDETLFFRAGATPEVQISEPFAITVQEQRWQLIEIYRNAAGQYQVLVNGQDVTAAGNPSNTATYDHRYLGAQNCNGSSGGMVGDLGLFLFYSDLLQIAEQQALRVFIDGLYNFNGLLSDDFESGDTSNWSSTAE